MLPVAVLLASAALAHVPGGGREAPRPSAEDAALRAAGPPLAPLAFESEPPAAVEPPPAPDRPPGEIHGGDEPVDPEASPPAAEFIEPAPPLAAAPVEPEPGCHVAGAHRVVVHTIEGHVKRGVLEDADLDSDSLSLVAQAGAAPDPVPTDKVKAIFFMLAPGEKAPIAEGKKVRVTFRDGRQVAGFSPDYSETGAGFFMIPGDTRTNTGRIWVYRLAVRQVAVS